MPQPEPRVNNDLYHTLQEGWYEASDHPVALLRSEARIKNPWVHERIQSHFRSRSASAIRVLDVGCGAGFLSNDLASRGYSVMGVDLSESSLEIAKHHDSTGEARYLKADAYHLPLPNASFEVVTCMDFLEHVDDPQAVVFECSRVLKPGGLFFFHTFNRTWLAKIVVIRGVEWFVKNTPPNLHVIDWFIKPSELARYCMNASMNPREWVGLRPKIAKRAFWKLLFTRTIPVDFEFRLTRSTALGYLGYAVKLY